MNRRNFLRSLIGGISTAAAVRTFPFRVFRFPSEITVPQGFGFDIPAGAEITGIWYDRKTIEALRRNFRFESMMERRDIEANTGKVIMFGAA